MALSADIKKLIIKEYRKDEPMFSVIEVLQSALRRALAMEGNLSVDDAEGPATERTLSPYAVQTGGAGGIIATGGNHQNWVIGGQDTNIANPRLQRESLHDQALVALDRAASRVQAARDPILAVVHAIPHLEALYPDEVEREAILDRLRTEIRARLPEESDVAGSVEACIDVEPDPIPGNGGGLPLITTHRDLVAANGDTTP